MFLCDCAANLNLKFLKIRVCKMFLKPVSTVGLPDQPGLGKDADYQVIEIVIAFEQVVKMIWL
jgi:hypothetical protein